MKLNILSLLALNTVLVLASVSAHATHAYRSEDCKSEILQYSYDGNYLIGGTYTVSRLNDATAKSNVTASMDSRKRGLMFNELKSQVIGESQTKHECYFDHEEWTSRKLIQFTKVTKEAKAKLGIHEGQYVIFTCEESSDYPNGDTCADEAN